MQNEYNCHFTDEFGKTQIGNVEKITAETPKDAASIFIKKATNPKSHILVYWGFGKKEVFVNELLAKVIEDERKFWAEEANKKIKEKLSKALENIESNSYFELDVNQRVAFSNYFNELVSNFETRSLLPNEIEFIRKWVNLQDRALGESLLTSHELSKPKAEQGKSPLGNMLVAGMAMSTMRLSKDIGAVSDQVENISEGMGFEG